MAATVGMNMTKLWKAECPCLGGFYSSNLCVVASTKRKAISLALKQVDEELKEDGSLEHHTLSYVNDVVYMWDEDSGEERATARREFMILLQTELEANLNIVKSGVIINYHV